MNWRNRKQNNEQHEKVDNGKENRKNSKKAKMGR